MSDYWNAFPALKDELFEESAREGYLNLTLCKEEIRTTIFNNAEFIAYAQHIQEACAAWKSRHGEELNDIQIGDNPKHFIEMLSSDILAQFSNLSLIDKYDIYQCLMTYWEETMQDDVYAIAVDGWGAGNDIEREMVKKKDGTPTGRMKSFEGRLIPKKLIIESFFQAEQQEIDDLAGQREELLGQLEELREEHSGDEGLLCEVINDKGNITRSDLQKRIKEIAKDKSLADELALLKQYEKLMTDEANVSSAIKTRSAAIDKLVFDKYSDLSIEQIKDLVVEKKWCNTIFSSIDAIYSAISHRLASRITELVERYEQTLPEIEEEVAAYEARVRVHLERMGFSWR